MVRPEDAIDLDNIRDKDILVIIIIYSLLIVCILVLSNIRK